MANAQQPTRRTRHIEIKHFALLDWVEQDLLTLVNIGTSDNAADAMTKPLPKQLFYRHRDTYMGYRIPDYVSYKEPLHTQHRVKTSKPLANLWALPWCRAWGGIGPPVCR
jgi:hypothetical protein